MRAVDRTHGMDSRTKAPQLTGNVNARQEQLGVVEKMSRSSRNSLRLLKLRQVHKSQVTQRRNSKRNKLLESTSANLGRYEP